MPLSKPVGTAYGETVGVFEGVLVDVTKGTGSKLSVDVGVDVGLAPAWKITGRFHAAISIHSHKWLQRERLLDVRSSKMILLMQFSVGPLEQVNPEKSDAQKTTASKFQHQSIQNRKKLSGTPSSSLCLAP